MTAKKKQQHSEDDSAKENKEDETLLDSNEDPDQIIDQIILGFKHKKHVIHQNRKEAIEIAIKNLKKNQVLLILGKGIEEYQIVKGEKIKHSDNKIIKDLL